MIDNYRIEFICGLIKFLKKIILIFKVNEVFVLKNDIFVGYGFLIICY